MYSVHRWVIAMAVVTLMTAGAYWLLRPRSRRGQMPAGYVADLTRLSEEYARLNGKTLKDEAVHEKFRHAASLVARGNYSAAATLLEETGKAAAVPAVFNNLGVLYAHLGDRARATNAFREALARDSGYRPVRENLARHKDLLGGTVEPVTEEIEPNGTTYAANLIGLERPVEGAISGGVRDSDCFKVSSPPVPRDVIAIEIANRSQSLAPALSVYDDNMRLTPLQQESAAPGESLLRYFAPAPNTNLFIKVWGFRGSEGDYVLTVRAMKAFDAQEPNDDVFTGHHMSLGKPVEANIMDAQDTDYYTFTAPRTEKVTVMVQNRSSTLVPALAVYTSDAHHKGFGPDVRVPGESLRHVVEIEANATYHLQVFSKGYTSGAYRLMVE
jgi:hypothetical protein